MALSPFFLRFFIPQVLLYSVGTVATAVLFAKRRFVIVRGGADRQRRDARGDHGQCSGSCTGPPRTSTSPLPRSSVLAIGGATAPRGSSGSWACRRSRSCGRVPSAGDPGRGRPRAPSPAVAVGVGGAPADVALLLGAALVMGNQVAGGVVAYQFCFVAFLAPYAIPGAAHPDDDPARSSPGSDVGAGDMRRSPAGCGGGSTACRTAAARVGRVRRARASRDAGARGGEQPPRGRSLRRRIRIARCGSLHVRDVPVLRGARCDAAATAAPRRSSPGPARARRRQR